MIFGLGLAVFIGREVGPKNRANDPLTAARRPPSDSGSKPVTGIFQTGIRTTSLSTISSLEELARLEQARLSLPLLGEHAIDDHAVVEQGFCAFLARRG
jgi:hypothetical protein